MTPLFSSSLLRSQTDERLLSLAAAGHDRAFETIVERYRRPLLRACRRMLPESRAEDAVQTTFVRAWSALQAGTEVRDLKPWLYRIAHNQSVDALARRGYDYDELEETLTADPGALPEVDYERREVIRNTLTSVAGLPERQRAALLGVAVEGRPHEEVARELGMTDGALRQLLHRARTQVRAAATAITPGPLVVWAASSGGGGSGDAATRIAELATGGGGAAVTAMVFKAGAVVVATGALVTQAPKVLSHHTVATAVAAPRVAGATSAGEPAAAPGLIPAALRTSGRPSQPGSGTAGPTPSISSGSQHSGVPSASGTNTPGGSGSAPGGGGTTPSSSTPGTTPTSGGGSGSSGSGSGTSGSSGSSGSGSGSSSGSGAGASSGSGSGSGASGSGSDSGSSAGSDSGSGSSSGETESGSGSGTGSGSGSGETQSGSGSGTGSGSGGDSGSGSGSGSSGHDSHETPDPPEAPDPPEPVDKGDHTP